MISDEALLAVDGLRKLYPVGKHRIWRRAAAPAFLHAVENVSFTIERGETVGLVGESGCGKSTIVRLIARLLDASDGSICYEGEEIGRVPARRFGRARQRAQIQVVFQDATDSLNPRFTAFRAIADPLLRLQRLSGTALHARVEEVAGLTGVPQELLTRFPHHGVRRGADILIAFCLGAQFVFFGRPTLYGAVAGGLPGVKKAFDIFRGEIDLVMGQIGCPSLDQLGPDFLWREDWTQNR
jgi:ABC-type microcin C transport system duplicated ATPase subunit YejF